MNLGTKPLASASRALTLIIKNGAVASQTGELLLLLTTEPGLPLLLLGLKHRNGTAPMDLKPVITLSSPPDKRILRIMGVVVSRLVAWPLSLTARSALTAYTANFHCCLFFNH